MRTLGGAVEAALRAVREGRIKIIPEHFTKVYYNWLENSQDWCISRQLWWGHQIPVWIRLVDVDDAGEAIVAALDGHGIDDAVLVPEVAVGSDLGGRFVMVVGEGNVAERRFIQLGAVQDRAGEGEPLFLSTTHRVGHLPALLRKVVLIEQLFDPCPAAGFREGIDLGYELQVLQYGHVTEQ